MSEKLIQHTVKYRKHIIFVSLLVFIGVTTASYFLTGRTYKSGVEFYIIKASFDETKQDNNAILLPKEDIEIIRSITTSEQLFLSVVNSKNLTKYYNKKFAYQAEEILRTVSTINIEENSKISIYVEDSDNHFAFSLSTEIMNKINQLYSDYLKSIKKTQTLKYDQQIYHYAIEKQTIVKSLSKYPISSLNLKFSDDSLNGINYLKRINKFATQSGLKIADVTTILNLLHRLDKVEEQIYSYTDQKQQIQNSLFMLNKNHVFITNKKIQFKHSIPPTFHILLGLKIATLTMGALIVLIILLRTYKNEILMIIKPKT